jgi:hypothetical protein
MRSKESTCEGCRAVVGEDVELGWTGLRRRQVVSHMARKVFNLTRGFYIGPSNPGSVGPYTQVSALSCSITASIVLIP